jgi:flagellar motor switch protein FliN/FliY
VVRAAPATPAEVHEPAGPPRGEAPAPERSPRTLDLLMEVDLPVSVSFGRAQLPLKDVLKLSIGSIVELNRTLTEPVEVIVNNCVIARGEVVVVEGNYGVRIQEVISREKRLRTLQ